MPDVKARNEYGVETVEFQQVLYPVLGPLEQKIVEMLDAGFESADIAYSLGEHIHMILSRERITRTLKKSRKERFKPKYRLTNRVTMSYVVTTYLTWRTGWTRSC